MSDKNKTLKQMILDEMTVDYASALEKHFKRAKQFIRISKEGKVEVLHKDKFSGQDQILLYLIGKLYAKEAGLDTIDDAGNKELMDELGIIKGSLLPALKGLRDKKVIKPVKRGKYIHHGVSLNMLEKTFDRLEKKLLTNNRT